MRESADIPEILGGQEREPGQTVHSDTWDPLSIENISGYSEQEEASEIKPAKRRSVRSKGTERAASYGKPSPSESNTPEKTRKSVLIRAFEKIQNLRYHPYTFVPCCPKCGSWSTGRYVKMPYSEENRDYMERESLRFGEIVWFIPSVPKKNLFCVDCEYKWHGIPETRRLSTQEINEEVERRGTYESYLEVVEEQEEKKKHKSFLKRIL